MNVEIIPRWNVKNIFPSIDSNEYTGSLNILLRKISDCEVLFKQLDLTNLDLAQKTKLCAAGINALNDIYELGGMMNAYLHSFITTDSRDEVAARKNSEFEKIYLQIQNLHLNFQVWVGKASDTEIEAMIKANQICADHAFNLRTLKDQARYLMTTDLEVLANELALSGTQAWNKLQGAVTSQLSVPFEVDGVTKDYPMPALINFRSHPQEDVRRRAYETEMQAWKSVEVPLAMALNGVKGTTVTLNNRRGRTDAVHSSIDMARIERKTLEVMLASMVNSLPTFHKYFLKKADRIGKKQLDWWDLFAPDSSTTQTFTWSQTKDFILTHFGSFSPELSNFARRAFEENWIDAEQRDGKRGGAFCMGIPGKKESRILCNFDGSLDQVGTIAHELGHAFHNECAYQANKTEFQQDTPMTLAETASIMCETIVVEALLKETKDQSSLLAILGNNLVGESQVIVDIYSRYLFESEIFKKRESAELSANEINDTMLAAQKAAYGNAIHPDHFNKYAWTWKPHYYYSGLSFYNFPYAFGLLFAKGLYEIYKQRGSEFIADYKHLLASTGEASAEVLASRFNIDIQSRIFWDGSLKNIANEIELYNSL